MTIFEKVSLPDAVEGKVIYILGLVIIVQTIYPITANESLIYLFIYQILYAMLIGAGILIARESPRYMIALTIMGIAWLVSGVIFAFNQELVWINLIAYAVIFVFQGLVIRVLVEYIFLMKSVTRDVLYASIAVYILLGALFVPIYGVIDGLTVMQTGQHAFIDGSVPITDAQPFIWQNFIYYSYATLTTLGYGDILPVTLWARSTASIQAVVGVLYTVIIMGRLVGVYVSTQDYAPENT